MKRKPIPDSDKMSLAKITEIRGGLDAVNSSSKALAKNEPPKSLSLNTGEILDQIYATLGGVQGSKMYWLNHEEQFRTMIETKFLTKQVLKEAATAQGEEIGKNIFMTFIQNNGLAPKEPATEVEATVINPEIEEKKDGHPTP